MPYDKKGVGYQHTKSGTSQAAGNSVNRVPMRMQVLKAFRDNPAGLNAQEVAEAVGRSHYYGLQPRITELVNAGLVFDTGKTSPLPTGNGGTIWAIVLNSNRMFI